jgi:hypothetical protein
MYGAWRSEIATHHVTRHNMPIHNILWTAPQLSISQKALGTLPEDGNVMPKHVGATIHNFSCIFLVGILNFKGLTPRHLYKSFDIIQLIELNYCSS